MPKLILILLALSSSSAFAEADFAEVTLAKGRASATLPNSEKTLILSEHLKLPAGAKITTAYSSYVRLKLLSDSSTVNIGPNSTLEIKKSAESGTNLMNLITGKLRAIVEKSTNGDHKEKMIVTTKNTSMGIRGTDFVVTYDAKKNLTSLMTFSGRVAMVSLTPGVSPEAALAGNPVLVGPGTFSTMGQNAARPTPPAVMPASTLKEMKKDPQIIPTMKEEGKGQTNLKPDLRQREGLPIGAPGQKTMGDAVQPSGALPTQNTGSATSPVNLETTKSGQLAPAVSGTSVEAPETNSGERTGTTTTATQPKASEAPATSAPLQSAPVAPVATAPLAPVTTAPVLAPVVNTGTGSLPPPTLPRTEDSNSGKGSLNSGDGKKLPTGTEIPH